MTEFSTEGSISEQVLVEFLSEAERLVRPFDPGRVWRRRRKVENIDCHLTLGLNQGNFNIASVL